MTAPTRLPLAPLSLGALHQVVTARTGRAIARPEMARVLEVSGGNPFCAVQLAGTPNRDGLPGTLTQLVATRLAGLGADLREVLLAAAAAAEPTVELVARAAAAPHVTASVEVAERAEMIRIDEQQRIRFTHPLLGRIPDALRLVGETVRTAERLGDPALLAVALAESVMSRFLAGDGLDQGRGRPCAHAGRPARPDAGDVPAVADPRGCC